MNIHKYELALAPKKKGEIMKLKDKLQELDKDNFIKIVGNCWSISTKNPNREFKAMFKDILDKDIKRVDERHLEVIIYL